MARRVVFAAEKGMRVAKLATEAGSGLNGHRQGLMVAPPFPGIRDHGKLTNHRLPACDTVAGRMRAVPGAMASLAWRYSRR